MKFAPTGPQAILASAWGQDYASIKPADCVREGNVASVLIVGPLSHHGGFFDGDTYDAIESRVAAALATPASIVVLKIDSPGGEGEGCFECANKLQNMAKAAGKRLIAYVDECAASAAYALACAADSIYLPASAGVGSIGVIQCAFDETAADAKNGVKVAVVTSGARKADGNPHVALTPECTAEMQRTVDALAAVFFGHVAAARKLTPEVVQSTQAAMFRGQDAVNAKLANDVMSWDQLLAMLASGESVEAGEPTAAGHLEASMPNYAKALEGIKAALAEDAPAAPPPEKKEGEAPAMDAAGFKAALKALFAEEPAHTEPDGDEGAAPAKPSDKDGDETAKAAARAAAAKPAAVVQVTAPQASSPATDPAMQMAAELQSIKAQLAADREAKERAELLAQRPDFSSKVLAMLAGKPIDYLRFAVENFPKSAVPSPAAAAQAQPLLGAGQGSVQASLPVSDAQRLNAAMGLTTADESIRWDRHDRVFPAAMSPKAALEIIKNNEAAVKAANERTGGAQ